MHFGPAGLPLAMHSIWMISTGCMLSVAVTISMKTCGWVAKRPACETCFFSAACAGLEGRTHAVESAERPGGESKANVTVNVTVNVTRM